MIASPALQSYADGFIFIAKLHATGWQPVFLETLNKLLPNQAFPFLLAVAVWLAGGYLVAAPFIYERVTIPLVKDYAAQIMAYTDFKNRPVKRSQALAYARCVYDDVYKDKDFRFDFALWVSSFGHYERARLKDMKTLLDKSAKGTTCRGAYGTVQKNQ